MVAQFGLTPQQSQILAIEITENNQVLDRLISEGKLAPSDDPVAAWRNTDTEAASAQAEVQEYRR